MDLVKFYFILFYFFSYYYRSAVNYYSVEYPTQSLECGISWSVLNASESILKLSSNLEPRRGKGSAINILHTITIALTIL